MLPVFMGLLFLVYDAVVIGYDWMAMQKLAQQAVRDAAIDPDPTYLSDLDILINGSLLPAFSLTSTNSFSNGMAPECNPSKHNCDVIIEREEYTTSDTDDKQTYVKLRIRKNVALSPAGELLAGFSGTGRTFSIVVQAMARREPTFPS